MTAGTSSPAHAALLLLEEQGREDAFAPNSPWRRDAKGRFPEGSDDLACERVFDAYLKASNARTGRFDRRPYRSKDDEPDPADVDEQPDDEQPDDEEPAERDEVVDAELVDDEDDQELEPDEDEEEEPIIMGHIEEQEERRGRLVDAIKKAPGPLSMFELGRAIGLDKDRSPGATKLMVMHALKPIRGKVVDWDRNGVRLLNGHAPPLTGKAKSGHFGGRASAKKRVERLDGNGVTMTLENGPPLLPPAPQHVNGGGVIALLKSKEAELEAELAIVRRMLSVVT